MTVGEVGLKSSAKSSWLGLEIFVPSVRVRFAAALFLTFFPVGVLYPLEWPVRELVTLISWLFVFPSVPGILCLALLLLLPSAVYGYWAFNVVCFFVTLGVACAAARQVLQADDVQGIQKLARGCVLLTLAIGLCQMFSPPETWSAMFRGMSLGDGGRGAGLLSEPSLVAAPLVLYLAILVSRAEAASCVGESQSSRKYFLLEALLVIVCMLVMTRSISVLIAAICFAPLLGLKLKKPLLALTGLLSGTLVAIAVFGERIREALQDTSGSGLDVISVGVGSWRSVPDAAIILNYQDFLLPGHPAELRDKINFVATGLSPAFAWIENTYSTFSAGASTFGLVVVACLFVTGIVMGVRRLSSGPLRSTWIMLYVANWFITPKFDAAGWAALGLLLLLRGTNAGEAAAGEKRSGPLHGIH